MRDLYDTIATGPVQGDSHRAILKSVAADLAGVPAKAPAEALDGHLAIDGRVMRVEAGEGRQRSPRKITPMEAYNLSVQFAWMKVEADVLGWYAAALRAMGPDPIPLAGTEEWVETDEAYAKRLGADARWVVGNLFGPVHSPRARLVPVQEPQL